MNFIFNFTFEIGKRVVNKMIAYTFADRLKEVKWKGKRHALRQPWAHEMVYRYFTALCKGETPWTFRFNRHNCSVWLEASKQTGHRTVTNLQESKFKKDKSSE